jgi:ribosomal protein L7Ae-like RNA K-turn-binding protein
MINNRVIGLLGMAQKAGKIVSGDVAVEQAVKSGKAKLILVAADASDNTRKYYFDKAKYYQIACLETLSKDQIGMAIGKPSRAGLAIVDNGFSKAILSALTSEDPR